MVDICFQDFASNTLQILLNVCADCIITLFLISLHNMKTSCMLLKLKEEINTLCKTKAHIQDDMNKKIKDIDHKIAIKMELQAQISVINI